MQWFDPENPDHIKKLSLVSADEKTRPVKDSKNKNSKKLTQYFKNIKNHSPELFKTNAAILTPLLVSLRLADLSEMQELPKDSQGAKLVNLVMVFKSQILAENARLSSNYQTVSKTNDIAFYASAISIFAIAISLVAHNLTTTIEGPYLILYPAGFLAALLTNTSSSAPHNWIRHQNNDTSLALKYEKFARATATENNYPWANYKLEYNDIGLLMCGE